MKKYIVAFIFFLALFSCAKGPDMPAPYVEVDQDCIVVPSFGITYRVSVESNTQWKLSISDSWVSTSDLDGAGNAELSFTIQENTGAARSCTVEIADIRSKVVRPIRFEQNGTRDPEYLSVAALRQMETSDPRRLSGGRLVAFVLSRYPEANYEDGQMALGDSFTAPSSGINVITADGFVAFEQGCELEADLNGALLSRVDGILTLTLVSRPEKTRTSTVELVPCEVSFSQLQGGEYESMYVCIRDVQVVQEYVGGSFARCPELEDESGNHILLSVREDASFGAALYNRGRGDVCGIAGGVSGGMPVLRPTCEDDAAFSTQRFGPPGVEELPYVFSFLTWQQQDACPKYLVYHELTYNPETKLVRGVVAEDIDPSVGATLELTCYGADATKIQGQKTYYWAEAAGHDNVLCTGFVSQNCKTKPAAECGWWWNVPLKTSLPPNINVSFGLAGTDYSLSDWLLSWSKDKQTWHDAESIVRIDMSRTAGPYYLYYTVPLTLTENFDAGDTFYVKLCPQGSRGCIGVENLDGHGASCQINLHSALVISEELERHTRVPANAAYFEPFDKLTAGMDYFYGEKLAAMLNFSGKEYAEWDPAKQMLLDADTRDVYERPGYAQIGFVNEERAGQRTSYKNVPGTLVLPELTEAGDYTLSFKAARYRNACLDRLGNKGAVPDIVHPDISKGVVRLLPEGTQASFVETGTAVARFSGMPYDAFKTYTLTIKGATAGMKIAFTSVPTSSNDMTRWFIDDILLVKNE